MKKIFLLLSLLMSASLYTMAQTTVVTDMEQLSNHKLYFIQNARVAHDIYLFYDEEITGGYIGSNFGDHTDLRLDTADSEAYQWVIYKSENNNYYLYHPASRKFIGNTTANDQAIPMTDVVTNGLEIRTTSTVEGYPFMLSSNGSGAINTAQTAGQHGVVNWSGGYTGHENDLGNAYRFIEVDDVEITDEDLADMKHKVEIYERPDIFITDVAQLQNDKVYWIKGNRTNSTGYLFHDDEIADGVAAANFGSHSSVAFDAGSAAFQWILYTSPNDNIYLYNFGSNKFVGTVTANESDIPMTDKPTNDLEIRASASEDYPFVLSTNRSGSLNTCTGGNRHGLMNWSGGYNNLSDVGNQFRIQEIYDIEVPEETIARIASMVEAYERLEAYVTVDYYYNDALFKSETDTITKGDTLQLLLPAFWRVVEISHEGPVTEDCTVSVTIDEDLPFIKSTLPDDITWYVVGIGEDTDCLAWNYNTDAQDIRTPVTLHDQITKLEDTQLWCFVGDVTTGFRIYNKAAGTGTPLRVVAGDDTATPALSAAEGDELFRLYLPANGEAGAFSLKTDNVDSALATNGHTLVVPAADAAEETDEAGESEDGGDGNNASEDNGSSTEEDSTPETTDDTASLAVAVCRVFTPGSYILGHATRLADTPAGIVNGNILLDDEAFVAGLNEAIAAVEANESDMTAVDNLSALLDRLNDYTSNGVELCTDTYYRIISVMRHDDGQRYSLALNDAGNTSADASIRSLAPESRSDLRQLWKLVPIEWGYKLVSADGSSHIGATPQTAFFTLQMGGLFHFVHLEQGQFEIADGNWAILAGWLNGTTGAGKVAEANSETAWYLQPVHDFDVRMNSVDNTNYFATLYLPFAATPADSDEELIYVGKVTEDNSLFQLSAINDIPAETGVLLRGSRDTYRFNIAETASSVVTDANNDFTGTLLKQRGITDTDFYVLGARGISVGLYYPNVTAVEAYKAYLPASKLGTEAAANGMRFAFGTTTGIDTLPADASGDGVYYDLSGRRVASPRKGLYIHNGRKVIIR